jgi:hypothetical protein
LGKVLINSIEIDLIFQEDKIMLAISLGLVFSVGIVYILHKTTNEEPWL